ncbi:MULTISPECIES: SDR family oxidoreductase [Halomonas]|uniref:SDR family oxidoreductase n=1 Tax=Halomonas TaxID=2745 RepID=UPI001C960D84|nr:MULTISPECIES: SDR family oxidoreductase [Halomonas]MBY6207479.1 SDR family oxidoreductase [Halomonas sp. DP3Y7-2]MBY6228288.1 SDR family oxidoreductase [Halomonas sp. DP3Y7-1]MCA0916353.1 SDR family oxidoreductase [Halomonas denitrificans]
MFDFSKKYAVISGASSGIGLAIAEGLAEGGANLVLLSRKQSDNIESMKNQYSQLDIQWHECDVTDHRMIKDVVDKLVDANIEVSYLINNVGIALGAPKTFWGQDIDTVKKVVDTNVSGSVHLLHEFLARIFVPQNKGTILNLSTITALEPTVLGSGEVTYHSSKAFLEGMVNSIRNELMGTDIRILTLRPGFVKTKFHLNRVNNDDDAFNDIFKGIEPLDPQDVALEALWMISRPDRISVKALDVVPTAQKSLTEVDRSWNDRH